jgi:hypothetical protein
VSRLSRLTNFADGMRCGGSDGSTFEIYDPEFWNAWRWFQWFLIWLLNKPRGTITMLIYGESNTFRVAYVRDPIPKVFENNE